MQRRTDRILTTHVGSLVRPPVLATMLRARHDGQAVDTAAFEACLDTEVRQVVRRQHAVGIDILNDGEYAKEISWSRYVLERLSGVVQRDRKPGDTTAPPAIVGKDRRDFAEFYREYDPQQGLLGMAGWAITGPITYSTRGRAALQHDIDALKRATADVEAHDVFMTAVAPGSVAPDRRDEHYTNDADYLFAVAEALRVEYRAILDAGFILQIDDAYLASTYDLIVPPGTMSDYRKWAALRVEAMNHALVGIPEDRSRYHVCWGSWNGPHVTDVPLKEIVDLVLQVKVGGYCLEMANARHDHEWRLWEDVKLPAGKRLVTGVISHCTNIVEHPELVAQRITRLAQLVGRENVIAGTDCGFAQGPFVRRVHPSIMWAKLDSLAHGARLASQTLWGRGAH